MSERSFPVIFARQVSATAGFYDRLGLQRHYQTSRRWVSGVLKRVCPGRHNRRVAE
jgi:hypothetical protein